MDDMHLVRRRRRRARRTTRSTRSLAARAVATLLAAAAGACGGQNSGVPSPSARATDAVCRPDALATGTAPVQVTVWASLFAIDRTPETFSGLIDTFNRSQRGVRVKLKTFASGDDMIHSYYRIPKGDARLPDVIQLWATPTRAAIDTGRVVPVQSCVDAAGSDLSDFLPQALASTRIGATQWGLPLGDLGDVLLYDKVAFARAGLNPETPPATLADMRAAAEALKRAGVAHPIATLLPDPLLASSRVPTTDKDGGHTGLATQSHFASSEARDVVAWVKAMYDDDLAGRPKPNASPSDDLVAVGKGDSAMVIESSLNLKDVARALAQGQAPAGVAFGLAGVPSLAAPAATGDGAGSLFLSATSSAERRAAAWSFLTWFEAPAQQARWHLGSAFYPARRSAAADPGVSALWVSQPLLGAGWSVLSGPDWGATHLVGPESDFDNQLGAALRDGLGGQVPIDVALARADASATRILAEYNADPDAYVRCHLAQSGCRQ